jgi:N-acetyl-gamma-glutamylphosphate reductase
MEATHFDNGPLRSVPFRVIMIGATGATGKLVVEQLLKLSNLECLTLLVRKSGKSYDDKRVQVLEVNFDKLGFEFEQKKEKIGMQHIMISCLGTTKGAAGSSENYRKIEVFFA